MSDEQTKVITAHIPKSLFESVESGAKRMERSKNWIIKQALENWIDNEEEKHRLTLEALDDVDNGRLISHEDMLAWAESIDSENPLPLPEPNRK